MSATMIKRTALYRLYDANDALLYVGITYHPTERFAQHRKESHWWHQVARREVTWHEHRPAAQDAEKRAIQEEIRAAVARVDLWEIIARHDPDVRSE